MGRRYQHGATLLALVPFLTVWLLVPGHNAWILAGFLAVEQTDGRARGGGAVGVGDNVLLELFSS